MSDDRIDHLVRVVRAECAGHTDVRTGKLSMLALGFVCLIVGASARDLAHWALGDFEAGPAGFESVWPRSRFRCGMVSGAVPGPDRTDRPSPAATDAPPELPVPGR